jgi:anthranilate/para-aminobenzoate synthase component II
MLVIDVKTAVGFTVKSLNIEESGQQFTTQLKKQCNPQNVVLSPACGVPQDMKSCTPTM